jgi:hypothetical protein
METQIVDSTAICIVRRSCVVHRYWDTDFRGGVTCPLQPKLAQNIDFLPSKPIPSPHKENQPNNTKPPFALDHTHVRGGK